MPAEEEGVRGVEWRAHGVRVGLRGGWWIRAGGFPTGLWNNVGGWEAFCLSLPTTHRGAIVKTLV